MPRRLVEQGRGPQDDLRQGPGRGDRACGDARPPGPETAAPSGPERKGPRAGFEAFLDKSVDPAADVTDRYLRVFAACSHFPEGHFSKRLGKLPLNQR
jgi:hypothetical protein